MKGNKVKTKKYQKAGIFLGIILLFAIWLYWGNVSIVLTNYRIASEKIPQAFHGFEVVQVSDLHNAKFGKNQEKLLSMIDGGTPDIIVVTGDLIDSNHTDVEAAIEFINRAVKIAPIYYVTGNHEAWSSNYGELKECLEAAGVTILENEAVTLEREGAKISLFGVDDPDRAGAGYLTAEAVLAEQLAKKKAEKGTYQILLSHRPECFETYVKNRCDLILSGHAHGGQVRIPFVGGLVAPNQGFFPKYTEGLHVKGNTSMIVSRGLGNSIIPLRVNNRPELVKVTLYHATSKK